MEKPSENRAGGGGGRNRNGSEARRPSKQQDTYDEDGQNQQDAPHLQLDQEHIEGEDGVTPDYGDEEMFFDSRVVKTVRNLKRIK